jgi:hypothetical protein
VDQCFLAHEAERTGEPDAGEAEHEKRDRKQRLALVAAGEAAQ